MTDTANLPFTRATCEGPCFYSGSFHTDMPELLDTFLETSSFTKGMLWLNGQPLGRIWHIGPQQTLYVPGPLQHSGKNDVVVFDLQGQPGRTLTGLDHPILDRTEAP